MTNYPPPQGQPPYGGPPLPYGQPGTTMAPKSNGFGVAALVTGLLSFCIPILGSLLAIVFGILGIKKSKQTNSGKGMSIAGLILGLVALAIWGLFGGAIWALIQGTAANRDLAKQFINDLAAGNVTGAANSVDPASITTEELTTLSGALSGNGTVTDITTVGINAQADAGAGAQVVVAGAVTFSNGKQKAFETRQNKINDQWKIIGATINDR